MNRAKEDKGQKRNPAVSSKPRRGQPLPNAQHREPDPRPIQDDVERTTPTRSDDDREGFRTS